METKANWPEKMECSTCAKISSGWDLIIHSVACVGGDTKKETIARAKQICALPAMVALLKDIHNDDGFYDGQENWQPNCFVEKARVLLRTIGEIG